jgi:hypothetical protein
MSLSSELSVHERPVQVIVMQEVEVEEEEEVEVSSLRYIDYICGHVNMYPILQAVEQILGIPIEMIVAPSDTSGPR